MNRKPLLFVCILAITLLIPALVCAQLSAPGSTGSDETNYPVFTEIDSIFIFCTDSEVEEIGALRAATNSDGTKTFLWEKYNSASAAFEFYFSESTDNASSEINGLADGGYRVTITQGANTEIYRAWVFNSWIIANSSLPDSLSNCFSFKLNGAFTDANLKYNDLVDNSEVGIDKNLRVQWKIQDDIIATILSVQVFNPPTKDTEYTLRVYDKYGCEGLANVTYISIVTKAAFTYDPLNGEAPLEVNFTNASENGDLNQYEWFFFRDLDDIKREAEGTDGPVDSIMVVAFDENPVFTYENTGSYMVKLVSKKLSENHTCVDTVYLPDYITVDSSFVAIPNVFTPNGDGTNDEFVVKFWSMESINISIFNRWGKKIHHWEKNNVRGFENTWTESVWDGRLMGGRYASPGVYYYSVSGQGRDGRSRGANGFFHLFRSKD